MPVNPKSLQNLKKFDGSKPGPGRRKGVRELLGKKFCNDLLEDYEKNGAAAIQQVRLASPDKYLTIILGTLPKQLEIDDKRESVWDDLSEHEIIAIFDALQDLKSGQPGIGVAEGNEPPQIESKPINVH